MCEWLDVKLWETLVTWEGLKTIRIPPGVFLGLVYSLDSFAHVSRVLNPALQCVAVLAKGSSGIRMVEPARFLRSSRLVRIAVSFSNNPCRVLRRILAKILGLGD